MFTPVTTEINECEGINPQLNSRMQGYNWEEFHHLHISDLHTELRRQLKDTAYEVRLGPSLQVRDYDNMGRLNPPRRPKPDLSIRDVNRDENRLITGSPVEPKNATRRMEAAEAMNTDPNDYLYALVIWDSEQKVNAIDDDQGKPVAWIELLSPSNKPGGTHFDEYEVKRFAAVQHGQTLVEIDYLHETRPIINSLPRYKPDRAGNVPEGASPYYISVLDPRPSESYPQGSAAIYQFGPEQKLPVVTIPLNPGDKVDLDFDMAYDKTFREHYSGEVDYTQLPERVHTYSRADRDTMAARQLTVMSTPPKILSDERRTQPLPVTYQVEGASRLLENVLNGVEPFPPPTGEQPGPSPDMDR